ncbi:MAG: hypothetical protein AAFV59_16375, partial [Pseudomonadota bacterium]
PQRVASPPKGEAAEIVAKIRSPDNNKVENHGKFLHIEVQKKLEAKRLRQRLRRDFTDVELRKLFEYGILELVTPEGAGHALSKEVEQADLPTVFEGALDRKAVATIFRKYMVDNGLSQRAAAEDFGVSTTDIERILRGDATLDKSTALLIDKGFSFSIQGPPTEPV